MAFTHNIVRTYQEGGRTTTNTLTLSGNSESAFSLSVAVASPDTALAASIKYAGLKALMISSDLDLTIETNDGTTPDDTIEVAAGKAYYWSADDGSDNPLTADVTALYLTATGTGSANVEIRVLQDAT